MIESGVKLGRYEIRSQLGAGGMGEVYRARDTQLGRDVAIKVLPSTFSVDQDRLRRFEQEACAASALNHPNILIVHDISAHDGAPYVVSELLEGETLRKRIASVDTDPGKLIRKRFLSVSITGSFPSLTSTIHSEHTIKESCNC